MNRKLLWVILAAFALPIVARYIWFFPGIHFPHSIATPDYASFSLPQAPVSTPRPADAKLEPGTVLVDYAHTNQFQLSEIQSLSDALTGRGAQFVVDSDPSLLAADLKSARAYLVISPSTAFTSAEIHLLQEFVSRGGRLVVFTDATRGVTSYDFTGSPVSNQPDANVVNPLLEPFGLTVNADYLYDLVQNEGNFRNVFLAPGGKSDLTAGVARVAFYGTHSVSARLGTSILVGDDKTLSSETDATPAGETGGGWPAAALSQDGNVLAVGDFTFLTSPYDTVADNALLIGHIADFLLDGPRKPSLSDYPYLFQGSKVNVLVASGLQMNAGMIGKLAKLQAGLDLAGLQFSLVTEPPSDGDVIVLDTYPPGDAVAPYLKPFGLKIDAFGSDMQIPPFGTIGRSGNALLLLHSTPKGSSLVLLADSADDMSTLLDDLSSADLSGCILQDQVGLCSVGSSGYGGSYYESFPTESVPTPEGTPALNTGG